MKKVGRAIRESVAANIRGGLEAKGNTLIVSYDKLSATQFSDFRKLLQRKNAQVYVSNKRVAQKILRDLKFGPLADRLKGQTAFIWSDADSSEISKAVLDFIKKCESLMVQGGLLGIRILEKEDIKQLSELPAREVLLSMLLGTIQAPLTRLAGALNGKTRELLSVLKQLSEQKGGK